MRTNEGLEDTVPHILNLGKKWRWVVSIMSQLLYSQENSTQHPPRSRFDRHHRKKDFRKDKTPCPCPELKPNSVVIQPVA
jgi:hypothetical protein